MPYLPPITDLIPPLALDLSQWQNLDQLSHVERSLVADAAQEAISVLQSHGYYCPGDERFFELADAIAHYVMRSNPVRFPNV